MFTGVDPEIENESEPEFPFHAVNAVNDKPQYSQKPVGYLRAKIFGRGVLSKVIIDSGNLYNDLISEELCKKLNLKIIGKSKQVGTASSTGTVLILGQVQPFKIYLENMKHPVLVRPSVVRNLAHPVNLGERFLREHGADMNFRINGIQLKIKGSTVDLEAEEVNLVKPSIDKRIQDIIDKFKELGSNPYVGASKILDLRIQGVNYTDTKQILVASDNKRTAFPAEKLLLKARHTTVVTLRLNTQQYSADDSSSVLFVPKKDNKYLNKNELFVHPGVYIREGNYVKVQISNYSHRHVKLHVDCAVGHCYETNASSNNINVLDHKPNAILTPEEVQERRNYINNSLKLDENTSLTSQLKDQIIQVFLDNWDAVSVDDADYGRTSLMKFHIELQPGAQPVRQKLRPLNPFQEDDLKRQLNDWEAADVIEPSISPWGSALVPCQKKGSDKLRWCVDYRQVNSLTVKDAYPLANIETNLNRLAGAKIFSTLDSAGAFHSLEITPESRDITAFITPFGQFRFKRLPFGLANAPSSYSRLLQLALAHLPPGFVLGYIDDLIIYSGSIEEHLEHLRQVVKLHATCGMKLNVNKCKIFQSSVEYLGHMVSQQGVSMIPEYVQRVLQWPLPTSSKELKSFLGFTSYYRSFIPSYAELTSNMTKIKNQLKPEWNEATKAQFQQLKECFKSAPVRGYPQYYSSKPFVLDTDYSSTNCAAVLSQEQEGKEVFLACMSKKNNRAEQCYASHKGELLALVLALKKFEHILRARPFVVRTDSRAVTYLQNLKEIRGIWARWSIFIQSFQFTVEHRAGSKHVNADALSRVRGIPEEESPTEEEILPDIADIYHIAAEPHAEISPEKLRQAQHTDPVLKLIIPAVRTQLKPDKQARKSMTSDGLVYVNHFECLTIRDDILYYQEPEVNGARKAARICLPVSLQLIAYQLSHESGTAGHFGVTRTYSLMQQRFFYPHMYHHVNLQVRNCSQCLEKSKQRPKKLHQQHREELSYFGQRVYTDCVGPLPVVTYKGQEVKHVLTIMDGFTRYTVAVPIPDLTTSTTIRAFIDSWVLRFGMCEVLHSDNGTNFSSEVFRGVMKEFGILKTFTPPVHPEGNRVERAHQVLGQLLRSDPATYVTNWAETLPTATFAYNSAVNRVTGCSPHEAVYGRPPLIPLDVLFPYQDRKATSWDQYAKTFKSTFAEMTEKICSQQNTVLSRLSMNEQLRSQSTYVIGDKVYHYLSKKYSGKLDKNWVGPFEIQACPTECLVVLRPIGSWFKQSKQKRDILTSVDKIRPYTVAPELELVNPSLPVIDLDEIDWETEGEEITFPVNMKDSIEEPILPREVAADNLEDEVYSEDEEINQDLLDLPQEPRMTINQEMDSIVPNLNESSIGRREESDLEVKPVQEARVRVNTGSPLDEIQDIQKLSEPTKAVEATKLPVPKPVQKRRSRSAEPSAEVTRPKRRGAGGHETGYYADLLQGRLRRAKKKLFK